MVQKTITGQLAGGKLRSLDKEHDDDGITYDVELTAADGQEKSFTLAANGAIMSEQVSLQEVTPAARRSIKEQIGDGKILRIDRSLLERNEGVLPYEVQGRKNGKPFDFSVGPRGRFLGMDD
jgi:uncharacterized membrane protein YkoI